jgi:hypothetical protein
MTATPTPKFDIPRMPSTEQNFNFFGSLWGYWWIPAILLFTWIVFKKR